MRGVAREVDAGEFLFEPGALLAEFFQRRLDGLDLLPFGRDVVARVRLFPLLSTALVAAGRVAASLGRGGRGCGTTAFFEPVRVVLEVSLEVRHRPLGYEPELVAHAAQE